jgi:tRNA-2-methylthio-N6-dimethylallyladenosine synthase
MKYFIETYGCQMNKAESAALETLMREHGWTPAKASPADASSQGADASEAADLVLINTCSVRATAENRAWGRIDLFAARKREAAAAGRRPFALVVTGCMAERMKRDIRVRQPEVDYVIGTFQKQAFGLVLDAVGAGRRLDVIEDSPAFIFAHSYYEPGAFRSFVPIMHGCNNFCTYCIVPYLRGREVSRDPADVLAELDRLEDSGVREATLLGQNVNSYRWKTDDGSCLDFPGLLRLIARHLRERGRDGIRWVRFLTSHPKDLSDDVMDVLAEEPLFCRHIHLCVQSGSDAVLRAMNRHYDRAYYLGLVDRLKARLPALSLSTDILVGFPGETEEDLELTLDLMRRVDFSYSFMYHFNPREGTPAATMAGRVPDKVKKARLARVIELQRATTRRLMEARVGEVDEVLIEDLSKRRKSEVLGRTQRDEMVVFPADPSRIGDFAKVRILSLSGNTFRAEEIDAATPMA